MDSRHRTNMRSSSRIQKVFEGVLNDVIVILLVLDTVQAIRFARSEGRIIDGVNVTPVNKFPMIVAFQNSDGEDCAGTILNKYFIMSSAYCCKGLEIPGSKHYVLAGIYNLGQPDPLYTQNVSVKNVTYHIRYDDEKKGYYANNIGVIELNRALIWNDHVAPTNFPPPDWTVVENKKINAIAVGWGLGRDNTYPYDPIRPLQEVTLPLLTTDACQRRLPVDRHATDDQVCIERIDFAGTSRKDWGGPLFIYNEANEKHIQIGITSWTNYQMDPNVMSCVFTKVAKYVHWVEEAIRECDQRQPPKANKPSS